MNIAVVLSLYILLDIIWIQRSYNMYNDSVKKIQKEDIKLRKGPAVFAYALLLVNIIFVLLPCKRSIREFALSGFVIYGVYNATTLAILKDYSLTVAIIDTLWGTASHAALGLMLA